MRRLLEDTLKSWKEHGPRTPVLIRGARQVGKTYLIRAFAGKFFQSLVEINFDLYPEYKQCFNSHVPSDINNLIKILSKQEIIPGKTLLFLDEIQECPEAIMALRYYKELMPELHVIAAGSLLEFTLQDDSFSMPVGRVLSLYLKPLSFKEFLFANGYDDVVMQLEQASIHTVLNPVIIKLLEKLLRIYFVTGGMPEVIQYYLMENDFTSCKIIQASLLNTFRNDFGKYAKSEKHKYLQRLFEKTPGLIAEQIKYSHIDSSMQSRDLKDAVEMLKNAGLIHQVFATNATGLPLNSLINPKKYKLLFLDIGLVKATSNLDADVMLQENLMLVNHGKLVEQFVGQELLAYRPVYSSGELNYWQHNASGANAEVDYVINVGESILPVEVKSGKSGTLKSLHYFLQYVGNRSLGIKISMQQLGMQDQVLSVPLYMISELDRIIKSINT